MTIDRMARLAWPLTAAGVALAILVFVASVGRTAEFANAVLPAVMIPYMLVGGLIASRRPDNSIGWLFLIASVAIVLGALLGLAEGLIADLGWRIAAVALALIGAAMLNTGFAVLITFLILLFPDGHAPSPRWRPVLWIAAVVIVLLQTTVFIEPVLLSGNRNPIVDWDGAAVFRTVAEFVSGPLFLALPGLAVAGLASRYRHASSSQRLQLRWFLLTAAVMTAALVVTAAVPAVQPIGDVVGPLVFALLPVSVALAILRHRLFDVDLVINRTLVYGSLSASLAAVYVASVIVLQSLLSGIAGGNTVAVAASTLAVAAIFQPIRRRIQALVDRRFYRSRYNAQRTLEAFGSRLRHEVDLAHLTDDLRDVVTDTMQPAHVSVWIRSGVNQSVTIPRRASARTRVR